MLAENPPRDPIDERARAKAAAKAVVVERKTRAQQERMTLARASREYHERVIEPARTPRHSRQWIASLEANVPENLWHRALGDISAPEILDLVATLHQRIPETALRIRQRLEAVYDDAVFRGLVAANPLRGWQGVAMNFLASDRRVPVASHSL